MTIIDSQVHVYEANTPKRTLGPEAGTPFSAGSRVAEC
jgi:hypothetical protein